MNKDSIDEMEQIQRGLEKFLQQEMKEYQEQKSANKNEISQRKNQEEDNRRSEVQKERGDKGGYLDKSSSRYYIEQKQKQAYQNRKQKKEVYQEQYENEYENESEYEEDAYQDGYEDEEVDQEEYEEYRDGQKIYQNNKGKIEYDENNEGEIEYNENNEDEIEYNENNRGEMEYEEYDEDEAEYEDDEEEVVDWDSNEWKRYAEKPDHSTRNPYSKRNSERSQQKKDLSSVKNKNSRLRQEETEKEEIDRDSMGKKQVKRNTQIKGKKRRKKKSKIWRFLVVLAVIIVLLGAGLYALVGTVYSKIQYKEIESLTNAPIREEGVTNILLIGNDSRSQGEDGRSDAMILISVSSKTKKIYMTSILRDIYVEIPGYQSNRLNAAYSYGGAELLMDTIEQNFDISVNRYVLVNFQAFANLVDAVGGIDLEVTNEEVIYINGYLVEYNILENRPEGTDYLDTSLSGMIHLNGPQALAYSRNRYLGTDFGRTERQRKVLSEVIHKLPKAIITNPNEVLDGLMPNLTTNLTQGECFSLSLQALRFLGYEIVQGTIPVEGSYSNATIRKMAVLEVDFEKNKEYIRTMIYGEQ